ncbi:MAG TPA: tetraacyldisaccharide 4'-kinase, partial [Nitrospirota bacterium]
DHHSYTRRDMAGLASEAAASGAGMLVTTEKDAVKLGGILPERMRVAALRVDISFTSGGELLDKLITDRVVSG